MLEEIATIEGQMYEDIESKKADITFSKIMLLFLPFIIFGLVVISKLCW